MAFFICRYCVWIGKCDDKRREDCNQNKGFVPRNRAFTLEDVGKFNEKQRKEGDPNLKKKKKDNKLRKFTKWTAGKLEETLKKNDNKGAWETDSIEVLMKKITEEYSEVLYEVLNARNTFNPPDVIAECCDLAAAAMMLASTLDKKTKNLTRGR